MRPPVLRLHQDDLVVDSFAGGGGASLGIEMALGRSPDIAVNHDREAVAMHAANHPETRHFCEDVFDVDPRKVCGGRPVALAWFSPDCTFHSKARGAKPFRDRDRARRRRGLAGVVIRWAKAVRPRVISLENVEEWADWGPLLPDGTPDPERRGFSFRRWLAQLTGAGYVVEMRQLRACDYGAPTTRKRLFVVARCDGRPIVWPEPTHGPGRAHPYRTAAECIDWSLPCPSIFATREEGRRLGVKRPLAENTLRRIARGVQRYVIETAEPFVVPVGGRSASPTLIQTGYGERPGQAPRVPGLDKPLGTVVAGGAKHALVAAFLARHYGGHENDGASLRLPIPTITTRDHHALVALRTEGERHGDVRAFLTKYNGTGLGQDAQLPLGTITTRDRFGLVYVHGEPYAIADIGMRMLVARELFRAQGFPDSYIIDPVVDGEPLSQTSQIRMCGNSVSPHVACAIVAANVGRAEVVAA